SILLREGERSFWVVKKYNSNDTVYSLWSFDLFQEETRYSPEALTFLVDAQKNISFLNAETETLKTQRELLKSFTFDQKLEAREAAIGPADYILASSPVESFPLVMSVALPKTLALEAVRELQIRSIYFAIFVFGLTGLLSFWIGRALTQ